MNQSYNTVFVGKVCISLDNVDSTNSYAWRLLKDAKVVEGTLIVARHQYNGKGQRGSFWQTQKDENITMSVILFPKKILAQRQFYLNQAIALGVYNFAKSLLGEGVYLKWPNDIYYYNKKLGGILIENSVQKNYLATSIVGIGLNINQTEFPADLPNPTSLSQITGQQYELPNLLQKLCSCLEVQYLRLKAAKLSAIRQDYLTTLYRFGQFHLFQIKKINTQPVEVLAKIIGVTEEGKLILNYFENQNINIKQDTFDLKEVAFIL